MKNAIFVVVVAIKQLKTGLIGAKFFLLIKFYIFVVKLSN